MKIKEDKKVAKQLKKLQPKIQKKYAEFKKELAAKGAACAYEIQKLHYQKEFMRAKLDLRHRVALTVQDGAWVILQVSTRESFNYK